MSLRQKLHQSSLQPSLRPDAPILGKIGSLQTRLARTEAEVLEAQALRYEVFYNELGAKPSESNRMLQRDEDGFDDHCDHLLVVDTSSGNEDVVGTYRMMRQMQASAAGRFYSQAEFDLTPLIQINDRSNLLELGRSCILPKYRNKRTMELLWHGTWAHAVAHKIDVMFGCASFEGTDPEAFELALAWLANNALLDRQENCPAMGDGRIDLVELAARQKQPIPIRQAMAQMPPLIKGYLRLGARVAADAVLDTQFCTIDVLIVLKVAQINPRYLAHFGADASRFAG